MAMTKNACLPWLLQKTSLLRLTKNEQLVIFNIELTHSTENMSNDNVAWFSRFISPLRQKRVDMPWPLLAKSDALHFLQSVWCIAKNAQYSREKFSLESLLRIVSPQCIEISADSPIHKAEWPLFCISTFAMSHFLWTCYKIPSWIIDRRETKTNSYISNSFWLCCDFLGLDSRCLDIINVKR